MRTVRVLAHRGACGYAPENTMPAFQMALDMGADGIELDVQMTKDGEIVVIHDETINRTSNGRGWVKDYTLEELRQYNYNYHNIVDVWSGETEERPVLYPEYDQVDIPTMREVLELFAPTGKMINIELKTGVVFYPIEEKLVALVKEYGMEDRVIYSSFNHSSITKILSIDPNAHTGFLYADGTLDMPEYAKKHGVEALHPALYNVQYPGYVEACMKNGIDINVWTVNSPEHLMMAKQAHVTTVITNYPDLALEILEN